MRGGATEALTVTCLHAHTHPHTHIFLVQCIEAALDPSNDLAGARTGAVVTEDLQVEVCKGGAC